MRGRTELDKLLSALPKDRVLSLGVVDGRNIWRANLHDAFDLVEKALAARRPDGLQIAPSCSLIHSPVDLDGESKLDAELKSWMAFATQKLGEVATLAAAATNGRKTVEPAFLASYAAAREPRHLGSDSQSEGRRTHRRSLGEGSRAAKPLRSTKKEPACVDAAAFLPDHDHRVIPADGGGAQGTCRTSQG